MVVGIRLFFFFFCVVIIFSVLKIQNAFTEYKNNDSLPDIFGYIDRTEDKDQLYMKYWYYLENYNNLPMKPLMYSGIS